VYAIIQTGGKQYRVAPGDVLRVERLPGERGDAVQLDQVLLVSDDLGSVRVGTPLVANARVKGQIVRQGRAKKVLVFKKKRRKGYKRTQGHRQYFTAVQIQEIIV
jgi:large subunit ribosomal protein L21